MFDNTSQKKIIFTFTTQLKIQDTKKSPKLGIFRNSFGNSKNDIIFYRIPFPQTLTGFFLWKKYLNINKSYNCHKKYLKSQREEFKFYNLERTTKNCKNKNPKNWEFWSFIWPSLDLLQKLQKMFFFFKYFHSNALLLSIIPKNQ